MRLCVFQVFHGLCLFLRRYFQFFKSVSFVPSSARSATSAPAYLRSVPRRASRNQLESFRESLFQVFEFRFVHTLRSRTRTPNAAAQLTQCSIAGRTSTDAPRLVAFGFVDGVAARGCIGGCRTCPILSSTTLTGCDDPRLMMIIRRRNYDDYYVAPELHLKKI